ncbi:MAG: putative signal transducing protein [Anaerolineales bacterium]|jgi:hypothetical protein
MADANWVNIREVAGELIAENLRGLLEAQGIPVYLNQEGAGRAYGLNVGPLGLTQILVPENYRAAAEEVLEAFDRGDFSGEDESPTAEDD